MTWVAAAAQIATRAARGLVVRYQLSDWYFVLDGVFLCFLLAVGFAVLQGIAARNTPLRQTIGLPRRSTATKEWTTGAAFGWAVILIPVLFMALGGTLHIRFWTQPRAFWLVPVNLLAVAFLVLASQIAFFGYAYRRLIDAIGLSWATVVVSAIFGLAGTYAQDSTWLSTTIAVMLGVLLCVCWQRTHGLWLGWGLHFAWIGSLGIVYGLPVSNIDNLSSVVETRAIGAQWLTGGDLGPEGALLTLLCLIIALVPLFKSTRDWAWEYTHAPILPGGYPMDVAPPPAHAAMEEQAAARPPALVQILPSTPQGRSMNEDQ
jgi:membrane protease YdiL (CAAX protease family)